MRKIFPAVFLLILAIAVTMSCRKKNKDQVVSCKHAPLVLKDTTCNLPKTRKWHREYHKILVMVSDTMYNVSDTVLPLTILDNNTFTVYGDTFLYQAGVSGSGHLEYNTTNTVGFCTYKYMSDSITFTHWVQLNGATRIYYKVYYP